VQYCGIIKSRITKALKLKNKMIKIKNSALVLLMVFFVFSLVSGLAVKTVQGQNMNQEQNQKQIQTNAQIHESTVANFVQGLLGVVSAEEGIGEQVKTIAQQQNNSASTTIQSMERVQARNQIQTFLFGSDYRNLGVMRSEMVQTRNRLDQLNKLLGNIQNEEDKTKLQNQVQLLEQEQIRVENFIEEQEKQFSLFGWLVKWFSNAN
jgi:hypothetical protein